MVSCAAKRQHVSWRDGERGNEWNELRLVVLYIYIWSDSCSAEQEIKYSHLLTVKIYGLASC